jgi:hypothetical protein
VGGWICLIPNGCILGADQKPPLCFSKEIPIVSVNLDSALSSCYCCAFARAAVAG